MKRKKSTRTSPTGEVLIKLRLDETGEALLVEVEAAPPPKEPPKVS